MTDKCLLLFGDGALVSRAHIQAQVLQSRGSPFLSLFLQRASDALRQEIAFLSPLERLSIPAFNTIDELNDRTRVGKIHVGVQHALLCVSQLVHYIE